MDKSLTISKLDAAKRQLETFMRLYFNGGDPVAMHTLTAAASGVIQDLNERRGGPPTLTKQMFENVKPGKRPMLAKKLKEAQNYFKHADRDHEATLEFNPDSTELMALDACQTYKEMSGEWPPLFAVFYGWMMMTHQEIFTLPPEVHRIFAGAADQIVSHGRAAYFDQMLPIVMKRGF